MGKESQLQCDVECACRHKAQTEGMQSLGLIRRRIGQTCPPGGHDASCKVRCSVKKLSCPGRFYSTLACKRPGTFYHQTRREYSVQPAVLQRFRSQIDTFAPAAQREERQQLYADIGALPSSPSLTLDDDVGLFVFAQIVAAHLLTAPRVAGQRPERSSVHATWYEKERQRVAKLLMQIADSPVVASFQSAVT